MIPGWHGCRSESSSTSSRIFDSNPERGTVESDPAQINLISISDASILLVRHPQLRQQAVQYLIRRDGIKIAGVRIPNLGGEEVVGSCISNSRIVHEDCEELP
jgi:hypothetical protein